MLNSAYLDDDQVIGQKPETEAMSEQIRIVLSLLDKIGLIGALLVLWTVITCCALVGAEAVTVGNIWRELMVVWLIIASLTIASGVLITVADRKSREADGQPRRLPEIAATGDSPPPVRASE